MAARKKRRKKGRRKSHKGGTSAKTKIGQAIKLLHTAKKHC